MNWKQSIERSSLATLLGLTVHFAARSWLGIPVLTDAIAEWIMARTPSAWAVPMLEVMGGWAKPFASTGGLAALGFAMWLPLLLGNPYLEVAGAVALCGALAWAVGYDSPAGFVIFAVPAVVYLLYNRINPAPQTISSRRKFLSAVAMTSGTTLVAGEAYLRNLALSRRAVEPVSLFDWKVPPERIDWGKGLVRKPVTTVREFYVMSKNTVDPVADPATWRLKIRMDDRVIRELSYQELIGLPRQERYVTLRCVSNTLKSDLMGTAIWSGIRLDQLVRRSELPSTAIEMAVIGLDGHGDSVRMDYAFSDEPLFALGMNGETLNRNHGYPIRMLTPRYYGFKSIKWIDEIRFTSVPYFGTWPKLGFTKEPVIHTASFVDRIVRQGDKANVGGVSFAGARGIQRVEVRADTGAWSPAEMEAPLSPHTLTRWKGEVMLSSGSNFIEVRALDGDGRWQASVEKPLFPDGVSGPTQKRIPSA